MHSWRPFTVILLGVTAVLGAAPSQDAPAAQAAFAAVDAAAPPATALAEAAPSPASALPPAPVAAEVLDLRSDLDQLMRGSTARNADYAVLVVSIDGRDTLYSYNPDLALAPASNMKLFSTAAALYYLGPNFRYSTYALADGEIRDGVLDGDLVLYGTGDPTISGRMLPGALTPLRALADTLKALGVTAIRGDVIGDGSYFDDAYIAEGWRDEYRLASYSAPIGALSLAENVVSIRVMPGATGGPAEIRTTPATDGLLILNRVRTIASGRSSVRFEYDPEGLVIEGQIARGHPGVARSVTVVDPGNYAAAAFHRVLEEAGIAIDGGVRSVRDPGESPVGRATRAPAGARDVPPPPRVIATHLSPTLAEIATVTNHVSQNLYAEAMFKTVGRIALGDGSFVGGAQAVRFFLECEKEIDFDALTIVDGSGLSPINRITPRAVVHLLDLMTRTDVWEVFHHSLPEAASPNGGQHSLRGRMGGTAAARNLRAKTGTINGVSALSGYVEADNGELLAFSILGNDLGSTWQAKRLEDAIGARLARFSRPPPPAEPEPAPAAEPIGTPAPEAEAGEPAGPAAPAPPPALDAPVEAPVEAAPAPAPAPPAPRRTHRVASGEVLGTIAERYGTTVAEIQRANPGLNPNRIRVGQTIVIPGAAEPDTRDAAPTPAARLAPAPATPPATRTHRVARGEVLGTIAERYGTSVAELQRLNPGLDPRRLQVGQSITIPAAGSGATSAAPASATRTHRVASGETLDAIARRYGTTVAEIQRLNPNVQPRRLQVGQTINVPAR